jgi:glucokinase
MSNLMIVGVDLGGTRVRVARCDDSLNILQREETLTRAEDGFDVTIQRIKDLIRSVLPTDRPVAGIGFSAPGPTNPNTGVLVAPPNLAGWHNVPLAQILNDEFNVPVFVGNDANVAVLAETVMGAARGRSNVIYITVSTGIGGGIISNGHMIYGHEGLAAEIGHMPLVMGSDVTTLEKEAAGPAIARKVQARLRAGAVSKMLDMANGSIDAIDGKLITQACQEGDPLALDVVAGAGRILGLGIVSLLHVFNPSMIVIGGGVAQGMGDLLLAPARSVIQMYTIDDAYWQNLDIVPPDLSEDVSIVGAAALVLAQGGIERIDEVARIVAAD